MKTIFGILFLIISFGVVAQKRQNAIFIEVKGTGANLTLNYDTRFTAKTNGLGARAGFGYFGDKYDNVINIPFEINYLIGKEKHFFETGVGAVWGNYNEKSDDQKGIGNLYITKLNGWAFATDIGYRYQQYNRLLLRLNFTPLFTKQKIYPLAGISIGYSF